MKLQLIEVIDRHKHEQGDVTNGQLEAELTIKFKFRPAGWAGNDKVCIWPIERILGAIVAFVWFANLFKGDEKISGFTGRWRRPKQAWQTIKIEDKPD